MKKNLKVNLIWFGLIIGLFLILKGLELSGIMNLYYIQILMGIGISILMGLGTNLVLGFSGQFTLGQAGFMAIGAYSSAIITGMMPTYDGFYLSMVVGVIIAAIVALIFGLPTLRLKGDYLAIATLGMAEIIRIIIVNGGELTNGAAGLTGILPYTSWPVIYFFVVIITILVLNFLRSATGRQAITLREEDELIEVKVTDDNKEIILVTKQGQCIKFKETDVRTTGRTSMGVRGMNLSYDDEVVGMQLDTQGEQLLLVSEYGLGKRTNIEEFGVQHRGGKGVKCYKITEKTGNVVGAKAVHDDQEIMLITNEGIVIRIQVSDISILGRITSGVKLMNLDPSQDVVVASIAKVRKEENDKPEEEAEEDAGENADENN